VHRQDLHRFIVKNRPNSSKSTDHGTNRKIDLQTSNSKSGDRILKLHHGNQDKELYVKSAYTGSRLKQMDHRILRWANPAHGLVEAIGRRLYQLVVDKSSLRLQRYGIQGQHHQNCYHAETAVFIFGMF
jgi:hypothetical protein